MKPILIILNGPAGGGKSTIAEKLWKTKSRTAIIELDKLKWLISDYKSNEHDLNLASKIGLKMAQIYLSQNINVILEKTFCKKEYLLPFLNYAKRRKINFLIYNLEAPWEILQKRIKNRNHKLTLKKARKVYQTYVQNKFEVHQTFDTSKLSVNEIIHLIERDLKTIF